LVGAVELAKGRAFSAGNDEKYADLKIRVCDPVFYLFVTTGYLSGYSWRLLKSSGVVGMDGEMIAALLADCAAGLTNQGVTDVALKQWCTNLVASPQVAATEE
jgi:hypothetical protein